jgi:bifunctional ADP-heptose synthase (sugar kinase/adenylyltransferase)
LVDAVFHTNASEWQTSVRTKRLLSEGNDGTLAGHGMVSADREGKTSDLPADSVEIRDVCGAGETVLAALGAALEMAGRRCRAGSAARCAVRVSQERQGTNAVHEDRDRGPSTLGRTKSICILRRLGGQFSLAKLFWIRTGRPTYFLS